MSTSPLKPCGDTGRPCQTRGDSPNDQYELATDAKGSYALRAHTDASETFAGLREEANETRNPVY